MMDPVITAQEFRKRLADLCLKPTPGLPRRQRDRHILFKSAVMLLGRDRELTEKEVNAGLETWLETVGRLMETDHVTLRRHLVDEGYLVRDAAGQAYRVHGRGRRFAFEPGIDEIGPAAVVAEARRECEERRRQHGGQGRG